MLVLPVKDYAALAKKLGGKGDGLEEVKVDDKPMFVKDLGGGFAAIGSMADTGALLRGEAGTIVTRDAHGIEVASAA